MRVQSAPKVESSSVSGTNQAAETSPKAKSLAENAWEQMTQQWQAVETKTTQAIKKLPPEAAQMYQLQLLANQLHLRSVLVSKVGETVASTIQKLQQMGAGS